MEIVSRFFQGKKEGGEAQRPNFMADSPVEKTMGFLHLYYSPVN